MLSPWPSDPLETSTPGSFSRCGWPWKGRIQFAKGDDVFDGEISGEGQPQIERGRLVSGGPDDAVAIRPLWIVGVVDGDFEVQRRNNLHHGKRAAGVAGAGRAQGDQVVAAHQAGRLFQFFQVEIAHHSFGESVDQGHVRILEAGRRRRVWNHIRLPDAAWAGMCARTETRESLGPRLARLGAAKHQVCEQHHVGL